MMGMGMECTYLMEVVSAVILALSLFLEEVRETSVEVCIEDE